MPIATFIQQVAAAILAIFNIEATIDYDVNDTSNPIVFTFTVTNPAPNKPDFVWPYEMNPDLIQNTQNGGEEYRASAISGIVSRVVSDLLQQWLASQTARPIKQPIDRI